MAEGQRDEGSVGSVAEEAARLLDALGGWAERSGYAASAAAAGGSTPPDHRCAECGAETGVGRAASCRVCPLCQGIALLRSVRPETVDRLADLAAAVAATLRDVAGERRGDGGPATPRRPPTTSRVQDIPVDDDGALA